MRGVSAFAPLTSRPRVEPAATAAEPQSTEKASSTTDFGAVYEEHLAFAWRSVRRLGIPRELVDDVVQDVFVIVFRRLHTFRGMSSMRTWLFGILRRVVRDRRRSYRRVHQVETPWDESLDECGPHSQPDRLERQQAARIVRRLLARLDDDKREVFILAELEEMTVPEIAEATGVNLNTVYSRLRASRRQFEDMLRDWQTGEPSPTAEDSQAARPSSSVSGEVSREPERSLRGVREHRKLGETKPEAEIGGRPLRQGSGSSARRER